MKKVFAVFISLLLIICSFASCSRVECNAVILQEGFLCHEKWLENNQTLGSLQGGTHEYDDSLPESRTYIIQNQAQLEEIFSDFPEIDFDKETVLVYCYTTVYLRKQRLEKVSLENDVLTVAFDVVRGKLGHADAAAPHTRLCVIRLDKVDVTEVNITYNGQ